ncbi:MAG: hypothetical protein SPI30_02660 [Prevotella sp.]|nr:hypothetical protein [Prevotella sp.]
MLYTNSSFLSFRGIKEMCRTVFPDRAAHTLKRIGGECNVGGLMTDLGYTAQSTFPTDDVVSCLLSFVCRNECRERNIGQHLPKKCCPICEWLSCHEVEGWVQQRLFSLSIAFYPNWLLKSANEDNTLYVNRFEV